MRVYFYDIMKDETVIKLKKIKSKDFPSLKYKGLTCPGIVDKFMDAVYDAKNLVEEHLWLICLNTKLVPNAVFEVSHGSMTDANCSPVSIFQRVLITGASGFIGSFIVEEALKRKFGVWAGIRPTSSKKYLKNRKIHFLELDFAHPNELRAQLSGHKGTYNKFDYIIHCAGVTKCPDKNTFDYVNYLQTKYFIDTLKALNMVPKQFIYISTLSVFGPVREKDYSPIEAGDVPMPNTAYGLSKLKAELYIQSIPGFPYVIYRPTGVYGPRELDYFLMAKSIRQHVDFSVGFRRQDLTFVYVKDIVQAIFLGIEKKVTRRAYFLTDGKVYNSRVFSDLIQKELGNPFVIHVKCPLIVLKVISLLAEFIATRSGKSSTLNSDKYKIMKQRNWQCDITPAINELGYAPEYDLEKGVRETIDWYKNEGWL